MQHVRRNTQSCGRLQVDSAGDTFKVVPSGFGPRESSRAVLTDILHFPARVVVTSADAPWSSRS
jgi:hypothetical protein